MMNWNMYQRVFVLLLILGLNLCYEVEAVSTSAKSAILMELDSGRVLYEENSHEERLIASITKILTALVAVEMGISLDEVVEITSEMCAVEGSSIYLKEGEEVTFEALLYGMLLHSGNDAATAIAIHCGGTVGDFVGRMNEKVVELGLSNSSFENPHGLNAEFHYSTAYDMAMIARACLENEIVAEVVGTESISMDGRHFNNKNKLLSTYEGCIGMKTGYTELAGRTLVSAAERDGMTLICVTLDDGNDWVDHGNLFDYGFSTYEMKEISVEEAPSVVIPVENSLISFVNVGILEDFRYPVKRGEEISAEMEIGIEKVSAPVFQGEGVVGRVIWYLNGEEILQEDVGYLETVENLVVISETFFDRFTRWVGKVWLGE